MNTIPTHAANLSVNRTKFRQVLDCASPLALFQRRRANRKRQRTAAVQDAVAPNALFVLPQSSKLPVLLLIAVAITTGSLLILCKASAHAQGGVPLWTNRYNGPANYDDHVRAIAVDSSGNVFVTGISTSSGDYDYATIGYSSTGVPLWTRRYTGPGNGEDCALAVDGSGDVFVAGSSTGSDGNSHYATIAYSGAGVPLWTNRYSGPGNGSVARAIALDSSGNVFVTGWSGESFNGSKSDYATIKYSNAGVPLWTNRYVGPANADHVRAIAVDHSGNVFVTGVSNGSNRDADFVTIKYSSSVPPPRLDFQLLSKQLVLSWTNAGFNLQSAPAITGTFTNLPTATSPYTNSLTAPQQFFRLKGN